MFIKTLIDYMFYIKNKRRIIKLFKDKGNDLSIYTNQGNGFIQIEDKESEFLIEISDLKRNTTKVIIPILKGIDINKVYYLTNDYNNKTIEGEVMDKLKLNKYCCRRHMLTHVDIQ